jgi:hypothetical protein
MRSALLRETPEGRIEMDDKRNYAVCSWCGRLVPSAETTASPAPNSREAICADCASAEVLSAVLYDAAFRRRLLLQNPAVIDYCIDEMEQQFR